MLKVSSIQMQTIPQDREWFRTRLFIFVSYKNGVKEGVAKI